VGDHIPCDVCSSGRQWQCAGGELAAGGAAAGHTAVVVEAAGGTGLAEEERASTHWGPAGDMAAAAGSEDVEPCRVAALGAVEGAWCSSRLTSSVSELSTSLRDDVQLKAKTRATASTYMRRLRIRAIRGVLRGRRLPVCGKLALATLVRKHDRGGCSGSVAWATCLC
jgi:hypothetical protein